MNLKLKAVVVSVVLGLSLLLSFGGSRVHAIASGTTDGGGSGGSAVQGTPDPATQGGKCATLDKCDLISEFANPAINFLAALIGVVTVISIIIGGIQYGSSGGDPSKVTAAKTRIRNSLIALLTFFFLYALLNFLIPGGLL